MKKNQLSTVRRFFMTLLMTFALSAANASTDPTLTSALVGSTGAVVAGDSITTSDTKFYGFPASIAHTFSINNIVTLSIDPSSPYRIQSDFTTSVELQITATDSAGTNNVFTETLEVSYSKDSGTKYNGIQYYAFQNAVKVKVKILSISSSALWNTSQVLIIKNDLTAVRDYKFVCDTVITNLHHDSLPSAPTIAPDELNVSWNDPANGQTEYDLEWAWVDSSALAYFPKDGYGNYIQKNIFNNNATRVSISGNSYNIPLLYDGSGILFFRVRPAQLKESGQRIEGAWTVQVNNTTSCFFTGHENNLNWQASTSYAEEGKHKSVVQYFDGTLRNRQTVTKDNTTGNTIVAETFYDYQGRPAIQVLPAPTLDNIIHYAHNFNTASGGTGYQKTLYDKVDPYQSVCGTAADSLSNSSGAAQYYSPNNPLLTTMGAEEFNKYIPDAKGYPFTETRYATDGTGRVGAQGGVGPNHQLGSNHETIYNYQVADQRAELDPLFGTDAGDATHYFKTTVKDANGQYSVSYTDMHGRTVATALAGDVPVNLLKIPSFDSAARSVTRNLLGNGTNIVQGKSIIASQSLVVMKNGAFKFDYHLTPENLALANCDTGSICYDCLYDLTIRVASDCNDTASTIVRTKRNFSLGSYLNVCTGDFTSPAIIDTFTLNLNEGAYTVTKELKLSKDAMDHYRDSVFVPHHQCKALQDFVNEEDSLLQANSNCHITCDSCNAKLGSNYSDYRTKMLLKLAADSLTAEQIAALEPQFVKSYAEAKASCNIICNGTADNGYDYIQSIHDIMLQDMVPPSGQYARYNRPAGQTDPTTGATIPAKNFAELKYNIFNTTFDDDNTYGDSLSTVAPAWRNALWFNPVTDSLETENPYKDEFDQIDSVNAKIRNTDIIYTQEQFGDDFKNSWAVSLLPHHPEYCKLRLLEDSLPASYAFEARLNQIDSWHVAYDSGFISSLISHDPFFSLAGSATYYTAMNRKIVGNYKMISTCDSLSMWQVALGAILCRNTASNNSNSCSDPQVVCMLSQPRTPASGDSTGGSCADKDYSWKIFRSLYLSERKVYISQYLNSTCGSLSSNPLFVDGTYRVRFPDLSAGLLLATGDPQLDQVLTDISNGNFTTGAQLLGDQADATCKSYAAVWMTKLRTCPGINSVMNPADSITLIDNLVGVCKKGYDATHPSGASSISPDSSAHNGYSEFPQVIRDYLVSKGINPATALCHPYLIDVPAPYNMTPALSNTYVISKPTECECEKLHTLQAEFNQPANHSGTFSNYLLNTYGTHITQGAIDTLLSLCSGDTLSCVMLPVPITIPPVLQCNGPVQTCIDCNQYATIKNNFYGEFGQHAPIVNPITDDDIELNKAFAAYANYKTGFSKLWTTYVGFDTTCSGGHYYDSTQQHWPVPDTATANCHIMDSLLVQYYQQYILPQDHVDLDMRTFYGNKTPLPGPKGVFDVNGNLLGNTIDSSLAAVDSSYASIWNAASVDSAYGHLTPLSSGRFRLYLNPGKKAPCNGITGMRYYKFDNTVRKMDGILTGPGCFADFGDSLKIKIETSIFTDSTHTYYATISEIPTNSFHYTTHNYVNTGLHIVTIYHSDTLGTVGFDNYNASAAALPGMKNFRGYGPEQTLTLLFHSTQDSSMNTFSKISNAASVKKHLRWVNFGSGDNHITFFENYNFGNFDSAREIQALFLPNDTSTALSGYPDQKIRTIVNNPLHLPKLKYLVSNPAAYSPDVVLNYPNLYAIDFQQGFSSVQVDTIINQIARYSQMDSGYAYLCYANGARTSASDRSDSILTARGWHIYADGASHGNIFLAPNIIIDSNRYSSPAISQFSEFFSNAFNMHLTEQQVLDMFQHKCGYTPDKCAASVNCALLQSLLQNYYTTYLQPGAGYADLDMRTFYGNKTPDAGPKGVFDVNGNFIANTVSGSTQDIKNSFATIWNSAAADTAIGTLAALTSGKFRLTLKPGKTMPCKGVTGMRYYRIDHTATHMDAIVTGPGCFADFGDSTRFAISDSLSNSSTHTSAYHGTGSQSHALSFYTTHTYAYAGTHTITVYHSDTLGFFGFDNDYGPNASTLPTIKNFRGYVPEHSLRMIFRSTQDSTTNRFDSILNKNTFHGLMSVNFGAGDIGSALIPTAFTNYHFGNMGGYHDMQELSFDAVPDSIMEKMSATPANYPNLKYLRSTGTLYHDGELMTYPHLGVLQMMYGLSSAQVDTIINQIGRVNVEDSGWALLWYGDGPRTSASDAAYTLLTGRGWRIFTTGGDTAFVGPPSVVYDTADYTVPSVSAYSEYFSNALGQSLTIAQVDSLFSHNCSSIPAHCTTTLPPHSSGPLLCGLADPIAVEDSIHLPSPCAGIDSVAATIGEIRYQLYLDSIKNVFDTAYANKCLKAGRLESFTVSYTNAEHHYTLYYYDQAGNLVQTIPPAGIEDRHGDVAFLDTVAAMRARVLAGGPEEDNILVPSHTMATNYRYNSLNQVISQNTPDAGESKFYYDRLGRLVLSKNAKQAPANKYSYTEYDQLGRITQVGQITSEADSKGTDLSIDTRDPDALKSWFDSNDGSKEQITRTVYDVGYFAGEEPGTLAPVFYQSNLRNRVSYTQVFDLEPDGTDSTRYAGTHNSATYYSYDIHGNVDTLVQDFGDAHFVPNMMNTTGNRFKKIVYDYDLISGKVNMVSYQPGYTDQFYHRYSYDAENRLTDVETSHDKLLWEHDARYSYYRHGPLARTIIGEEQVQGMDYAYTIQGWLKGVNSSSMFNGNFDMGKDGKSTGTSTPPVVTRDAYGFNLNYFTNDYTPIGGTDPFLHSNIFARVNVDADTVAKPLFNGNIASMFVNIPKTGGVPQLYGYAYDQLNRIRSMDVFHGYIDSTNAWGGTPVAKSFYKERVGYDANGNILSYLRNGDSLRTDMDDMTYNYTAGTNKLDYVADGATDITTGYSNYNDIRGGQSSGNYVYDDIGNLISDGSEIYDEATGTSTVISEIDWSVYGKITNISKSPYGLGGIGIGGAGNTSISYTYDAAGNRISKKIVGSSIDELDFGVQTWYVRDASGNVMSIYNNIAGDKGDVWGQSEIDLYGSSRLGIFNPKRDVSSLSTVNPFNQISTFERGDKFFELTNHLGNVLATISDRRLEMDSGSVINHYNADVITANDYYPFGMQMPGRKYNIGSGYRFGFNGKENDNEVKGEGNQLDYGMRIYDPRLGRFLSVDPLYKGYSWNSTYAFAENDVIRCIDLDGGEKQIVTIVNYYDESGKIVYTYKDVEDGNNKYRLGDGTLTIIKSVYASNPDIPGDENRVVVISAGSQTIYENKRGFFDWLFGKHKVGVVVWGTATGKDAVMGGSPDGDVKVVGVINLRDEDTKTVLDMLDIIGDDGDKHLEDKQDAVERVIKIVHDADEEAKENSNESGNGDGSKKFIGKTNGDSDDDKEVDPKFRPNHIIHYDNEPKDVNHRIKKNGEYEDTSSPATDTVHTKAPPGQN